MKKKLPFIPLLTLTGLSISMAQTMVGIPVTPPTGHAQGYFLTANNANSKSAGDKDLIPSNTEPGAKNTVLLSESFNNCPTIPEGWASYSVYSDANWSCTSNGASGEDGDYSLEMNGYGADTASEDWLVTPKMVMGNTAYFLSFNSMVRFSGPALEVLYSTNYTGIGDPNSATWTVLADATNAVDNNAGSYDFAYSGEIGLPDINGDVYLAFKYTSTGTGGGQGARYRIDDVVVKTKTLLYENFNKICANESYTPEGWTVVEIGTPGIVVCSSEGYENSADDYSIRCNGYGIGKGEAWLITPELALGASEYEITFASKVKYGGPMPIVLYSTDYRGNGVLENATWTEIPEASDAIGASFSKSAKIDLSFIGEDAHIAFRYISEGPGGGQSRMFLLDEVLIAEPSTAPENGDVTIAEIQGTADVSPLENKLVTTCGVVSKFFNNAEPFTGAGYKSNIRGFFIQDTLTNDTASYGIFVYAPNAVVTNGDLLKVTGKVTEYYGMTQINEVSSIEVLDTGFYLEPKLLTLPLASPEAFEKYESILVQFNEGLTITENRNVDNYGELRLSGNGMLVQPTQVVDPNDADAEGVTANGNSNVEAVNGYISYIESNNFLLDDARTGSNPDLVPYLNPDNNTVLAGSTINGLTGIMTYSFGEYRVQPTMAPDISFSEREQLSAFDGANVKVASFNVLNYFNGDGQGNGFPTSRGARSYEEFVKQTEKIVSALVSIDADVVGLMEIENDADNGYSAVKDLVDGINLELGETIYSFVSTGIISTDKNEADEIKVAFIYKTNSIGLYGDYAILTNAFDQNFNDEYNRPVLAQTFVHLETAQKFTVVVNHLKSKGSGCDDLGDPNDNDGQGNCNVTRTLAAGTLASWLESDPTNTGVTDGLIIGDLNSYAQEDPIDTLRSRGFINLVEGNYSYLYNGQIGTLDYGLATASMNDKVTETFIWHINSIEPDMLSYNGIDEFYEASPYRSSDHDPVIIGLQLIPNLRVKDFILVDAITDEDIMVLTDSTVVDLKELDLKLVNIRAEIDSIGKSVFMILDGAQWAIEKDWKEPYTIFPEWRGNYFGRRLFPGDYYITAYPKRGWFDYGEPLSVSFTVKDGRNIFHHWHKSAEGEFATLTEEKLVKPVVYPVPLGNELFIELYSNIDKNITIKLYCSLGNLIYSSQETIYTGNNHIACKLPGLSPGVYFLKIDGIAYSSTLVKD